jgi:hypothetical protein
MPIDQYSWPFLDAVIPGGSSLSNVVFNERANVLAVIMPPAWDAALLSFEVSIDGDNFYDFFDPFGNRQHVHAAAGRYLGGLDVLAFGSFNYFRVRSGTPAAPVTQTANRTIRFVLRDAK